MLRCERSAILKADTEAWLAAGNNITQVPRGTSAIDPETGMTGYTRRSYMESQKRGASATRRKYAKD
jgi:hypothetical protein